MTKKIELVGKKFGKLKVVAESQNPNRVICVCDCGNVKEFLRRSVRAKTKRIKSCGCSKFGARINLTDKVFGYLKVIGKSQIRKSKEISWDCACRCGNKLVVAGSSLRGGTTKSCGCYQKERASQANSIDLVGKKFGRLTVLKLSKLRIQNSIAWDCKCDCGNLHTATTSVLTGGHTKSCGCLRSETTAKKNFVHGLSQYKGYSVWLDMMRRCYDKNIKSYKHYGGRGIEVCDRWHDVGNFLLDMGETKEGLSIDRTDNNGNYHPLNCRWATSSEQNRNRRNNRILEFRGQSKCLVEWAEEYNLTPPCVTERLKRGWSIKDALLTPVE